MIYADGVLDLQIFGRAGWFLIMLRFQLNISFTFSVFGVAEIHVFL